MSFKKNTLWISFFTRLLFRLLAEPAIFSVVMYSFADALQTRVFWITPAATWHSGHLSDVIYLLSDHLSSLTHLLLTTDRFFYLLNTQLIHRKRSLLIVMDAHVGVLTWWLDLLTSCHKCAVEWHVFTSTYRNSNSFAKKWENEFKNEDYVYTATRSPVLQ